MRPKTFALVPLLASVVLTVGCSTGDFSQANTVASATNVAGNWQWTTTSQSGSAKSTIVGAFAQAGTDLTGRVHVNSDCFPGFPLLTLHGTTSDNAVNFTSQPIDGKTLTATITMNANG